MELSDDTLKKVRVTNGNRNYRLWHYFDTDFGTYTLPTLAFFDKCIIRPRSHKSFMRYIKVLGEQFADKLEQIWAERL